MRENIMAVGELPVEVSNRHVHLSRKHVEALFGEGYELKVARLLSQPGQFAAEETVRIVNGDKLIDGVRVIGPERAETQVELSRTDAAKLGIAAPLRLSGDIEGTPGITIQGPEGIVVLEKGVIMAQRHIHISEEDSRRFGLVDGQTTSIRLLGEDGQSADERSILDNLVVRVGKDHVLAAHIDVDEWDALGIEGDVCGVNSKKLLKRCSAFLLKNELLFNHIGKH